MTQVAFPRKAKVDEVLVAARKMVGIGTIFVCGTPTMVARSLSVVTVTEEGFRAPPSLIVMVAPPGTNLEEFFQGFSRGTGDFLESLKILGQVRIYKAL